jgi:hypothetical protein
MVRVPSGWSPTRTLHPLWGNFRVGGHNGNLTPCLAHWSRSSGARRLPGTRSPAMFSAVRCYVSLLCSRVIATFPLERLGVTDETWREGGRKDRNFLESESPLFVGHAARRCRYHERLRNKETLIWTLHG